MTVQAIAPLTVGQSCAIEVRLPNTSFPLKGRGEVVYSRQKVVRLRMQFAPESDAWLRRWLELNGWAAPASAPNSQVAKLIQPTGVPTTPPVLRVRTAPRLTKRPTRHYVAVVICALLCGVIVMGFAMRNGNNPTEGVSASETPSMSAPGPAVVPSSTIVSIETPVEQPTIKTAPRRVQQKPKVRAITRKVEENAEDEDEPEVVVRKFVNGHWVVVKRNEP